MSAETHSPAVSGLLDLSGRVAIITGASGGLGADIAQRFAAAGACVVVHYDSNAKAANAVVAAIKETNAEAIATHANVVLGSDVEKLLEDAVNAFGRVDVLVNNAGIYPSSTLLDMDRGEWDRVLDVNLGGVHLCTQVIARSMVSQATGGAIVNVASIEADSPSAMHSHYCAAKAGVVMHTRTAAQELGAHGIRVNSVSPGLVWRDGIERAWPDGVSRYRGAAALGRLGRGDEVADACLFLASHAARWITGANLVVDGGVMTNSVF